MSKIETIRRAFEQGEGILRLAPEFVPRRIARAGQRLRLHPDDYYALGTKRGAIKERWFSSVVSALNGPDASPDEGMSYVNINGSAQENILLKDFVTALGAELIGETLMQHYGTWPMYAKFFDYNEPLFHHLHLDFESAARVRRLGKPEAYYYPPQLNNYPGTSPYTYFGFAPDVTLDQVRERLTGYEERDNRITELSRAYRIELGTGWYTPPGVLHAPGSYLTYEPQWNSDIGAVYENISAGEVHSYGSLVGSCPEDKKNDMDYILRLMDWEKNIDPDYRKHYFRPPLACGALEGPYTEKWIVYGNEYFTAKELTVLPGQTVTVRDGAAYGCIFVQGHGKFGVYDAEAAIMLRFGQMSADEYFVSEQAARKGVILVNDSQWEPMVLLKHFANNHPDAPRFTPDGAAQS